MQVRFCMNFMDFIRILLVNESIWQRQKITLYGKGMDFVRDAVFVAKLPKDVDALYNTDEDYRGYEYPNFMYIFYLVKKGNGFKMCCNC